MFVLLDGFTIGLVRTGEDVLDPDPD